MVIQKYLFAKDKKNLWRWTESSWATPYNL